MTWYRGYVAGFKGVGIVLLVCVLVLGLVNLKLQPANVPAASILVAAASQTSALHVTVTHNGQRTTLRLALSASESSVKEAIAGATGLAVGSFALKDAGGALLSPLVSLLHDGEQYTVVALSRPSAPASELAGIPATACPRCPAVSANVAQRRGSSDDAVLMHLPPALPRVILAVLATGEYRQGGIDALESAMKFFGGDCIPSFHLLTDDVAGVPPHFNAHVTPYREWPDSGLMKFSDLKTALDAHIKSADYFFFVDADVRFNEPVSLVDVGADLMGVEHPMYPRFYLGWCVPTDPNTGGWCIYPFQRNKKSNAYIPESHGRFVKEKKYLTTNSWYFQSAFWGGKSKHIVKMLDELIPRIKEDIDRKMYSAIIQDELYLNWYYWKHANDTDLNIRVLSHSYLFPFKNETLGFWLHDMHRPIIIHGVKRQGKLIKDQVEVKCVGTGQCVDLFAAGIHKLGLYACHKVGDSQGFIWNGSMMRTAASGVKKCFDGLSVPAGEAIWLQECDDASAGQKWTHDLASGQLVNQLTNLCLDTLRNPAKYAKGEHKEIGVDVCDKASPFQRWAFNKM